MARKTCRKEILFRVGSHVVARLTRRIISIVTENKAHAYKKTHLHTMKVYIASPSKFW